VVVAVMTMMTMMTVMAVMSTPVVTVMAVMAMMSTPVVTVVTVMAMVTVMSVVTMVAMMAAAAVMASVTAAVVSASDRIGRPKCERQAGQDDDCQDGPFQKVHRILQERKGVFVLEPSTPLNPAGNSERETERLVTTSEAESCPSL